MNRNQADIVRAQLSGTSVHWAEASRELRELLIGLAAAIDNLGRRVGELEAERRGA
jgi:hypothetical protein